MLDAGGCPEPRTVPPATAATHLSGVGFSALGLFCITASGSKSGMGGADRGACALSHVTPRTVAHWTPLPWDFPGKSTGVGCHFLPQGIFLTEESNQGLMHCRLILYQLSHQGSHRCLGTRQERQS